MRTNIAKAYEVFCILVATAVLGWCIVNIVFQREISVLKSSTGCCSIITEKVDDHEYKLTWIDNEGSFTYTELVQEQELDWVTNEFMDFCLTQHGTNK